MACVYKHIRLDTGDVFYIGIGNKMERAYDKGNRNQYWRNIVAKVGYTVEISIDDISFSDAKKWEKYLIGIYGRNDLRTGHLCNMTDGGDGLVNPVIRLSGDKNPMYGRKGPLCPSFGIVRSEETKRKLSESKKGRPFKGDREHFSRIFSGGNNPAAKLVIDYETGIFYECAAYAAKAKGISATHLRNMLNGHKPNKTKLSYI